MEFETNEETVKEALDELESKYASPNDSQEKAIRIHILESFDNNREASQIDKNTSAIYLLQLNDMKNLRGLRNLVYAIEESPNYFKRYIIPYTETQVNLLQTKIDTYEGRDIDDILSNIANNEKEYYRLSESKNIGSAYELVIRLFSKLPFLQYKFEADSTPLSLERDISEKIQGDLVKYHNAIKETISDNKDFTLEGLLYLENHLTIDDITLDKELNHLLKGGM